MADIKTHLRELSVATTVGLLKMNVQFNVSELHYADRLYNYAEKIIQNDITTAQGMLNYDVFPTDLQIIINNGYKLGIEIYKNKHFHIKKETPTKLFFFF